MTYNAKEVFEELKHQSKIIRKILYSQGDLYIPDIKKLKLCIDSTRVIDNKIVSKMNSCGKWYCSRCDYQKSRIVFSQSFQLIKKLNNLEVMPIVKLVTLKIPKVYIDNFIDDKKYLKKCYYKLLKTKMYKNNNICITFENMMLGASVYHHVLFNTLKGEELLIGNHLHIIMFMKPSIASHGSITHTMLEKAWFDIISYDKSLNHGSNKASVDIRTVTLNELPNVYFYCIKKVKFNSLYSNSGKLIKLLDIIKGKQFYSHSGIIKDFRLEIKEEYRILIKEFKKKQDEERGYYLDLTFLDLTFDERYETIKQQQPPL